MAAPLKIITFKQLLNIAHERGLSGIETEMLRINDDGSALCKAVVTMQTEAGERRYTGHADAHTNNVGPAMKNCLPRMAETRSIVRALRLAVNIGDIAAEEMSDYSENERGTAAAQTAAPLAGNDINNTGALCPSCNAPDGKRHGNKCERLRVAA